MMTDESVVEWATGWLATNPTGDPTFRQRFIDGLTAELKARAESLQRAQKAVVDYAVAQGPHMSDSWKDFLVKECGLEIDEGNPYRHPRLPKRR